MAHVDPEDDWVYMVVVNHEEQYSIWPADRAIPDGWNATGKTGRKDECLAYIESVWTDMRPLSLRRPADEIEISPKDGPEAADEPGAEYDRSDQGLSLIERLSAAQHLVEVILRPERSALALKEWIDRDSLPIRFLHSQGPTELRVALDRDASVLDLADFSNAQGIVHLEGELTLNQVPVRCIVDLDLATLAGKGCLVPRVNRPRGTNAE